MILSLLLLTTLLAQSASPGATIRKNIEESVATTMAAIKQNIVKRSFVGEVTAKSDTSMTLASSRKQPRVITFLPDTTVKVAGKETSLADVKVGNFVISMGDVDTAGSMTAKRILVIDKPVADNRRIVIGTVTKATSALINIDTAKKESWGIKVTTDPKLVVGDRIMVIGKLSLGTNTLTALKIQKLTK